MRRLYSPCQCIKALHSISKIRNSPFKQKTIDHTIKDKLNLSKKQINKAKKILGLNDKKGHGALKKILEPRVDDIVEKINQVKTYHKDYFPDKKPIDKIILCGQCARLKDLDNFLTHKTKHQTSSNLYNFCLCLFRQSCSFRRQGEKWF